MKSERLLDIMGDIDSEFILEAEPKTYAPRKNVFARYAAMAAGFIVLFIIGTAVLKNTLKMPGMPFADNTQQFAATASADNEAAESDEQDSAEKYGMNYRGSAAAESTNGDIMQDMPKTSAAANSNAAENADDTAGMEKTAEEEAVYEEYPKYILNGTSPLELTENDPNRARIIELLEVFNTKPDAQKNEYDLAPIFTFIEANGIKHEYGDSVDAESEKVSYYERITYKNGDVRTRYFEADEDVEEFRTLINNAGEYEYSQTVNKTETP